MIEHDCVCNVCRLQGAPLKLNAKPCEGRCQHR